MAERDRDRERRGESYPICLISYVFSIFLFQGIRPEALEKVDNPEIRAIIEGCTISKTQER